MHRGSSYPYLFEYWQAPICFWPGFVPRKFFIQTSGANGDSWDFVAGGVVTDVGLADAFLTGDPLWSYTDPIFGWSLELLWHRVVTFPGECEISLRMALPSMHANVISVQVAAPRRAIAPIIFTHNSGPDAPFFNGQVPAIVVRPARWSEV